MFGEQKIAFTVSQKAINLVQSGKAVISSGGVRLLDGSLAELAKPAVEIASKSVASPITMVSSLANNVQSGFIQHGVNKANKKLDVTLETLDRIEQAVGALSKSNILSWASCAFSMANCGISITEA